MSRRSALETVGLYQEAWHFVEQNCACTAPRTSERYAQKSTNEDPSRRCSWAGCCTVAARVQAARASAVLNQQLIQGRPLTLRHGLRWRGAVSEALAPAVSDPA